MSVSYRQGVVTKDASRKYARSVETSMALPFVPMTLEPKPTSRPFSNEELQT